jgi:hypothetical protein
VLDQKQRLAIWATRLAEEPSLARAAPDVNAPVDP